MVWVCPSRSTFRNRRFYRFRCGRVAHSSRPDLDAQSEMNYRAREQLSETFELLTFFSAMYSIPLAMSSAKPVKRLGESGITGCREGGWLFKPFKTPRAARSSDKSLPRIAYSIISRWGSKYQDWNNFINLMLLCNMEGCVSDVDWKEDFWMLVEKMFWRF